MAYALPMSPVTTKRLTDDVKVLDREVETLPTSILAIGRQINRLTRARCPVDLFSKQH